MYLKNKDCTEEENKKELAENCLRISTKVPMHLFFQNAKNNDYQWYNRLANDKDCLLNIVHYQPINLQNF